MEQNVNQIKQNKYLFIKADELIVINQLVMEWTSKEKDE